jgi:hypothetical protein
MTSAAEPLPAPIADPAAELEPVATAEPDAEPVVAGASVFLHEHAVSRTKQTKDVLNMRPVPYRRVAKFLPRSRNELFQTKLGLELAE